MKDRKDTIVAYITAYSWPRGGIEVERARGGYTLYSRRSGARWRG